MPRVSDSERSARDCSTYRRPTAVDARVLVSVLQGLAQKSAHGDLRYDQLLRLYVCRFPACFREREAPPIDLTLSAKTDCTFEAESNFRSPRMFQDPESIAAIRIKLHMARSVTPISWHSTSLAESKLSIFQLRIAHPFRDIAKTFFSAVASRMVRRLLEGASF